MLDPLPLLRKLMIYDIHVDTARMLIASSPSLARLELHYCSERLFALPRVQATLVAVSVSVDKRLPPPERLWNSRLLCTRLEMMRTGGLDQHYLQFLTQLRHVRQHSGLNALCSAASGRCLPRLVDLMLRITPETPPQQYLRMPRLQDLLIWLGTRRR